MSKIVLILRWKTGPNITCTQHLNLKSGVGALGLDYVTAKMTLKQARKET